MISNVFMSCKKFFYDPLSFLLLFILLIPLAFLGLYLSDLYSIFNIVFITSGFNLMAFGYILKQLFWQVLLFLLLSLVVIFYNSIITTVILNSMINREYKTKRPIFNNFWQIFGLFFVFEFLQAMLFAVMMLLSFNTILLAIFGLALLVAIIIVLPRWIYLTVYILEKKGKIKSAFSDSWNKTKDHYFAILFFLILYILLYNLATFAFVNSIFLFYITSNTILLTILQVVFSSIIDAIFFFWFFSFLVVSYRN